MTQEQIRAQLRHNMDQLKAAVRDPDRDDGINPYRPRPPTGFTMRSLASLQKRKRTKRVGRAIGYLIQRLTRPAPDPAPAKER